jgi:hypothetical protein
MDEIRWFMMPPRRTEPTIRAMPMDQGLRVAVVLTNGIEDIFSRGMVRRVFSVVAVCNLPIHTDNERGRKLPNITIRNTDSIQG